MSLQTSGTPTAYGSQVTFTATIAGPTGVTPAPTGTVTFTDGSSTLGTGTISTASGSSVATFSTTALAVGTHSITASYSGDGNYLTSTTSGPLSQVVNKAPTTTTVVASASPITFGQSDTYTATVSGPTGVLPAPSGTVTFTDGSTTLGTGTLSTTAGVTTATFTASQPAVGVHTISASYGGDGNYVTSATTSSASVTVNKALTTITLQTSGTPATYGSQVTFTATVAGPVGVTPLPTGSVTFSDGSATLGSASIAIVGGAPVASLSTSSLAPGTHSITVSYGGDGNYKPSPVSATLSQVVNKATPTIGLVPTPSNIQFGQSVTLTATVAAPPGSLPRPPAPSRSPTARRRWAPCR